MKTIMLLLSAALLGGCAGTTPAYDARRGDAVRQARLAMTIDPGAGVGGGAVAGLDGRAAHEATGRYVDSFKAPPPVVNVINIGGAAGSGK